MSGKEARADFTEIPVITVHKKNIDKYKSKILDDIQVTDSLMLSWSKSNVLLC